MVTLVTDIEHIKAYSLTHCHKSIGKMYTCYDKYGFTLRNVKQVKNDQTTIKRCYQGNYKKYAIQIVQPLYKHNQYNMVHKGRMTVRLKLFFN